MSVVQNQIFTDQDVRLLTDSSKWKIVAPLITPEIKPCPCPGYAKWYSEHNEKHPHREILFALRGKSIRTYGGKHYPVTPGTVILYDKMDPHDFGYPAKHEPARHLIIFFFHEFVGFTLLGVNAAHKERCVSLRNRLYPMVTLGLISSDVVYPDPDSIAPEPVVRQCCANALQLVTSMIVAKTYMPDDQPPELSEDVIQTILWYIEENQGRGCSLETVARVAGYSKYHFARIFQKYANVSLGEYINDVKMRAFHKLVAQGKQYSLIAKELGFSHLSSLCRWRLKNGL